ncbi:MAG TPA: hypothetical protein VI791_02520 [Patescibacteria group bacterium]|nr:hypothetical protein [Patescibacteria group bacterium]
MAIQNDFTIYPKTKVIRHVSGTSTYTAVQFYSYLMNTFDEPGFLTYQTPIRFNTPTSFTMINGWFLDNGDGSEVLKYLYGGGIDTSGYATVSDPVYMMDVDAEDAAFVAGDLDLPITDDGVTVGPLLSFKANYPTSLTARFWVRDTRVTPADIAAGSDILVTGGTGDYSGNTLGPSVKGDDIYLNLFTIASFSGSPNPQVYIYQDHPVTGARTRIAEWSNLANWDRSQSTGPASPNLIDVLFPIQLAGTLIDSGNFTTFARQTGDSYTFVESTVTESGRTPIATETSSDTVNITKGEHYMFYTSASDPSYTAGTVIQDVATGGATPPTWYAEIVAHTAWSATAGYITLRGLRGIPADTNAIYVGASQLGTAIVNGSVGDTYVTYDTSATNPGAGDIGKPVAGDSSTAERIVRAFSHDEPGGKLLLQVYHTHGTTDGRNYTGSTRDYLYKDFTAADSVTAATGGSATLVVGLDATSTTLISGYSDITVAHMNGTVTVSGIANGPLILGDRFTYNAGAQSGILIYADSLSAPTTLMLGNIDPDFEPDAADVFTFEQPGAGTTTVNCDSGLTDDNTQNFEFSLQTTGALYSVFIEGGSIYNTGRSLSDIYAYLQYYVRDGQAVSSQTVYTSTGSAITKLAAEEYIKADPAFSATKTAPFGTLAGSTFFGATGVWLQGMSAADNNNIKLTDTNAAKDTFTLRQPFTAITLTISNTRQYDRIAIYLEDGSTTLPDKDTYASHATNNAQGDATFERTTGTAMPNDTPTSGTIVVVDVSANEEHRYRYDSRNGTSTSPVFTLPSVSEAGSVTTDTDSQVLIDSAAAFDTNVQVGDIIRRTNNEGGWAYVTSVDSATQITTTLLSTTANRNWDGSATADSYETNRLVVLYTGSDTFFVPYMDTMEDIGSEGVPGNATQDLTYVSDREVVIEVRNVQSTTQIVPFKTTGTITTNGLTQSVIRTEDTVFT